MSVGIGSSSQTVVPWALRSAAPGGAGESGDEVEPEATGTVVALWRSPVRNGAVGAVVPELEAQACGAQRRGEL